MKHVGKNLSDVVDKWKENWSEYKGIMIKNTLFPSNIKELEPSDLFRMAWNDIPLSF